MLFLPSSRHNVDSVRAVSCKTLEVQSRYWGQDSIRRFFFFGGNIGQLGLLMLAMRFYVVTLSIRWLKIATLQSIHYNIVVHPYSLKQYLFLWCPPWSHNGRHTLKYCVPLSLTMLLCSSFSCVFISQDSFAWTTIRKTSVTVEYVIIYSQWMNQNQHLV